MISFNKVISLGVLVCGMALANGQSGAQQEYVLIDGTVVKVVLPGTLRGNPQSDRPDAEKKVYICHATSAVDNNGYVLIHVGNPALEAHLAHEHAIPDDNDRGKGLDKEPRDEKGRLVLRRCQIEEGGGS